jgi:hypothetical protein
MLFYSKWILRGRKVKDHKLFSAILSIALCFLGGGISKAATLSLDLDRDTPGIQSTRTLNLDSAFAFEVVFTGDGATQFDTFALDVVYTSPQIMLHSPLAGPIVDDVSLMALDIYGANAVSSGDALTRGSMPIPLGFEGGLGGVGVSSVGGMPFPLLGQDETIGLFSGSLTPRNGDTSMLALSGFPFGVGAELSLGGERVPVTLQGATLTIVPLPPAVWLFATGVLSLLGIRRWRGTPMDSVKRVLHRWILLMLVSITPHGLAAENSDADLNGDAMVTSQDISLLASCIGQDPLSNSDCTKADIDEDGDIDADDFSFVSERLGEAYPSTLYPVPLVYSTGISVTEGFLSLAVGDMNSDGSLDVVVTHPFTDDTNVLVGNGDGSFQPWQPYNVGNLTYASSVARGDLNGDGLLDRVVANADEDDISVWLGNSDGGFQAQQRYAVGDYPNSVALGDLNRDGSLDVVVANTFSDNISVLLGIGDGGFLVQQRFGAGSFPGSVALGDLNGDGMPDAVVTNDLSDDVLVLLGNGDGRFLSLSPQVIVTADYTDAIFGLSGLGDLNGDSIMDMVVGAQDDNTSSFRILLGIGDGSFQQSSWEYSIITGTHNSADASLGDVNGDGILDMVVREFGPGYGGPPMGGFSVLLGNGDGSFQEPGDSTPVQTYSYILVDVNRDGAQDIVADDYVVFSNGDGTLQEQQYIAALSVISSDTYGDVNGDGVLDVVGSGDDGEIVVLLGNGDGSFQEQWRFAVSGSPSSFTLGDINGDGTVDLVSLDSNAFLVLLLGNGDGSFQEQQRLAVEDSSNCGHIQGVNLADINGDDVLDLVFPAYVFEELGCVSVLIK